MGCSTPGDTQESRVVGVLVGALLEAQVWWEWEVLSARFQEHPWWISAVESGWSMRSAT